MAVTETGRVIRERVVTAGFFVSMLLAIWGSVYPVPYGLCLGALIVTPLLALAVIGLSQGQLAIAINDQQGSLLWVFIFTMPVSGYRAYLDVHIFSKGKPLLYALVVALVMAALFSAVDKRFRSLIVMAVLLPVFTFTYGVGVVLESDMLLDRGAPQRFVTKVLEQHINWGLRYKTFSVNLAPWGGHSEGTIDLVNYRVYYSLRAGAPACVYQGAGAIGIPWHRIEACRE